MIPRPAACFLAISLFVCTWVSAASAETIHLRSDKSDWSIDIDPATLQFSANELILSAAQIDLGDVEDVEHTGSTATWTLTRTATRVHCELAGDKLSVQFTVESPTRIRWPLVPGQPSVRAMILPMFEGLYVPLDEPRWRSFLSSRGELNTTADLSMPFFGLKRDGESITYILVDQFNNELKFVEENDSISTQISHEVTPLDQTRQYRVLVRRGGDSPIEPARQYRSWLIAQHQFVTMAKKIERTPHAARLLGAIQAYLWDANFLAPADIRDAKAFGAAVKNQSDPFSKRLWDLLDADAQSAITQIAGGEWPNEYLKRQICVGLSGALETTKLTDTPANTARPDLLQANFAALVAAYPDQFRDPADWGDGVSTKMLAALQDDGIDRACLSLGDLTMGNDRPAVAKRADELGYVMGPYDSYHGIHSPDETNTWTTSQFDRALYETGAIVRRDGTKRAGFQKKGYMLSPLAARPYVEKRVNGLIARVPFTSWFVDCDAFGEVFDDYSPAHRATQAQDAQARIDRLTWLSDVHHLVVGAEGGSAYAAPAIHFAHGMMTPVIGWGDPDLKDRKSKYFLGSYYPPEAPAVFFKSVPCKPEYAQEFYDPRYRLPLYQAVFNDSVMATHHWSAASFKFSDQIQTNELLELLYDVPPLYHLNLAELKKRAEQIKSHFDFFSPLHRELALVPMTAFEWLTPDRLVQRTTFGEKTAIIANFSDTAFESAGVTVAPRSVVSIDLATQQSRSYSPAK